MADKGILLVISGPSGVGKGAAGDLLLSRNPNLCYSVSATTRAARKKEIDGLDYYFYSQEEFLIMAQRGEFLEWAEVYGNFYGTPAKLVEQMLSAGRDVVLELDTQGAKQVDILYPEGVFVFILPPSWDELKKRIITRGSESSESLACRLAAAENEMALAKCYDYVVINDDLNRMVVEIEGIIDKEKAVRGIIG